MMNIFQDVIDIFGGFGVVDYILYIAVVTLIILIVSLIYVMKNENSLDESENKVVEEVNNDMLEENTLSEDLDLKDLVASIDEKPKNIINMTAYEEEQERKAIISYDELINNANQKTIAYDDEQLIDDVIPVKKIQTADLELPKFKNATVISNLELKQKEPKIEVNSIETTSKLFSYEKEEAFLKALKELNELLN